MSLTRVPELTVLAMLVSVGRHGSMSAAGREHRLSQQTVSARVRAAERQMGVQIFVRTPAGVQPTAEGTSVLEWARSVLDAAEQFSAGVGALRGEAGSELTVAASMTIADYLVPVWTVRMGQRHPGIAARVRLMNSSEVCAAVVGGDVELGFIESPVTPPGLAELVVAGDELIAVAPPGHPWALAGRVGLRELAATPLVQREIGSGTRETLDLTVEVLAPPVVELTSWTAVKAAIGSTGAPAVMSSLAAADELAAGRLVPVEITGVVMPRKLRAVWREGRRLGAAAEKFVEVARAERTG